MSIGFQLKCLLIIMLSGSFALPLFMFCHSIYHHTLTIDLFVFWLSPWNVGITKGRACFVHLYRLIDRHMIDRYIDR